MSDSINVHGLPAKWREPTPIDDQTLYTMGRRNQRKQCADELEAALRQSGEAVAWRAEWDAARKTYWIQYHDETDPLPESFDDEPTRIIPLYTAPPATSGLVEALREALEAGDDGDWQSARKVILAALAAHDASIGK